MNKNAVCEVKEKGRWTRVRVVDALGLDRRERKRCPMCHGRVRLHKRGGITPAHFEHMAKWEGCPLCHRFDGASAP